MQSIILGGAWFLFNIAPLFLRPSLRSACSLYLLGIVGHWFIAFVVVFIDCKGVHRCAWEIAYIGPMARKQWKAPP
jgi:hypothetical protein